MERVGVLHQEFACPHYPEAGAALIAELGLDLIEICGQLSVAVEFIANKVSDDLLVRRPKAKIALVAIDKAQQLRSHLVPAARFQPQIR